MNPVKSFMFAKLLGSKWGGAVMKRGSGGVK